MEQNEIIAGNRLIRVFMNHMTSAIKFAYHEDWNELMPVVERIESLSDQFVKKIYVSIDGKRCAMWNYFDPIEVLRMRNSTTSVKFRKVADSKKAATWHCCVNFIQWYNTQTLKDKGGEE